MLAFEHIPAAQKSARHLALSTTFQVLGEPRTCEEARDAEIAHILAYDPNLLADALTLSERLIGERYFSAGVQTKVVYDIHSLAEYFAVERSLMRSAAKLCGAMRFQRGNKAVYAEAERASFVLDGSAIEKANAKARGE